MGKSEILISKLVPSKSSPFDKGGSRGILLRLRLPENHRSILTLRAKPNYTTSIAGGFWNYESVYTYCPSMLINSHILDLYLSQITNAYLQLTTKLPPSDYSLWLWMQATITKKGEAEMRKASIAVLVICLMLSLVTCGAKKQKKLKRRWNSQLTVLPPKGIWEF